MKNVRLIDCRCDMILGSAANGRRCTTCGAEFVSQQKADEMRYFAAWVGFTVGVVLMAVVVLIWMAVMG